MIPLAVNSTTLWLYDNIYFYIFIPRTKYEEEISTQPLTLQMYFILYFRWIDVFSKHAKMPIFARIVTM